LVANQHGEQGARQQDHRVRIVSRVRIPPRRRDLPGGARPAGSCAPVAIGALAGSGKEDETGIRAPVNGTA